VNYDPKRILMKYIWRTDLIRNSEARSRGLTMTEMLVVMALSFIVVSVVLIVGNVAAREIRKINANMEVNEEISRFQLSLKQIVTRSWTGLGDIEVENTTIGMLTSVPYARKNEIYEQTPATVTFDQVRNEVVYSFHDQNNVVSTDVLAKGVLDCRFKYESVFLTYDATFSTYSEDMPVVIKNVKGAVRFY